MGWTAVRGRTQAPPALLATGGGPHFALGPWGRAGHALGAGRGGAVAGSSAVRGGGGGGGDGDGDMESGAYGAAKAGGSFDLQRFLTQPQVVTRILCLVSLWGRRAGGPDWAAGPGRGRGLPRACERDRWRRPRPGGCGWRAWSRREGPDPAALPA